ncbi:hypothetical protein OQA88_4319 [Cercophora sp. LCS_1]
MKITLLLLTLSSALSLAAPLVAREPSPEPFLQTIKKVLTNGKREALPEPAPEPEPFFQVLKKVINGKREPEPEPEPVITPSLIIEEAK